MRFSIITAVYNRAETIAEAVQSVQQQKDVDLEHIIIDGASTDGTLQILKDIVDDRTKLISEPDKGIYDALNKGIGHASGEIVGVMHSDDFFSNEYVLRDIKDTFDEFGVDAVFGDVEFVRPDNLSKVIRKYRSNLFSQEKISNGWMPAHTSLYLKNSVFKDFGVYKVDYRIAADFEFVARIFKDNKVNYKYLPSVFVRMRTGGVSTNGFRSTLILNREVIRACRENGIKTSWMKILSKYPGKILEFLRA